MFKKRPKVNFEDHNISDELKKILHSEEPNLELDFESFRRGIQPAIIRKSIEIQAEKKRRNEVIQLAIGYGIALILTPLLILDYWVNGWHGETFALGLFVILFSLIMLGCSPLLVKFMKN